MKVGTAETDVRIALVAEIGNNHEGSVSRAQEMIGRAWEAGADAVKLQTFVPRLFVSPFDATRLEQMERYAISLADTDRLISESAAQGICVFSTPLDLMSLAALVPIVRTIKVASGDITFTSLLEAIAESGRDLILSTGGSSLAEVEAAVATVERIWDRLAIRPHLAILHCVAAYPAASSSLNLRAMSSLTSHFPRATIGYSDHTLGIEASVIAAAAGARIIEKHFTLNKRYSDFRDHALSADPIELRELRQRLDIVQEMLGTGKKQPHVSEMDFVPLIRRSLTLAHDLQAGCELTYSDLVCLRPGTGISATAIHQTVGRRLAVAKGAGEILMQSDLA